MNKSLSGDFKPKTMNKNTGKTGKPRKCRTAFTVKKDVVLLRSALAHNPWQTGVDKWTNIAKDFKAHFQLNVTSRTMKDRINLLISKNKKQQLKVTSGNEEEGTERGKLIDDIDAIMEEEAAAINIEVTADSDNDIEPAENNEAENGEDVTNAGSSNRGTADKGHDEVRYVDFGDNESLNEEAPVAPLRTAKVAKQRKQERAKADLERTQYMNEADGPSDIIRTRSTFENVLIQKRQDHEFKMEFEHLELEKRRENRLEENERRREERLEENERRRENRLEMESLRRDELAKMQLEVHNNMLTVLNKFMEK